MISKKLYFIYLVLKTKKKYFIVIFNILFGFIYFYILYRIFLKHVYEVIEDLK